MTNKGRLTAEFFTGNRQRLVSSQPASIIVLAGNFEMQAKGDAALPFTQESNFWWLTGLSEPDYWLIIDGKNTKTYLVEPKADSTRAVFDGALTRDELCNISGISEVLSADDGIHMLQDLARRHSMVYGLGSDHNEKYYHFVKNPAQKEIWQRLERTFNSVTDIRPKLSSLRAIKQSAEIKAIRSAIKLTTDAFDYVKSRLPDLQYEYQVEAEFSYFFRSRGAEGQAYDPIVAVGKNACTLHYNSNNDRIKKGSLLLIDIGARLDGYAADITRTYAVGEITKSQQALHVGVKNAHQEIINLLKPGLEIQDYHNQVDRIMKQALIDLKLIKSLDDDTGYRKYMPHAISHGLGVDVHDSLGRPAHFKPGMILTVEPGIYVPEINSGVRIEDDILITQTGHENLSRALSTDY